MEVGEVPKGIRSSTEAGGPPKGQNKWGQRPRPGSHMRSMNVVGTFVNPKGIVTP